MNSFSLADYEKGDQISKLVDESLVPTDQCLEDELLQFADRFQEWAMINKEIHESEDPETVDLNSAVTQARTFGLTPQEKRAILKVSSKLFSSSCIGLLSFVHT